MPKVLNRAICFQLGMVLLAPFLFFAIGSLISLVSVFLGLFSKFWGLQYFTFAVIGPLIAILLGWVELSLFKIAVKKVRSTELYLNLAVFMVGCGSLSGLFTK